MKMVYVQAQEAAEAEAAALVAIAAEPQVKLAAILKRTTS